jgi:hypothetical protein
MCLRVSYKQKIWKNYIFLNEHFCRESVKFLSVSLRSFTSNSVQIRRCSDPEWLFPHPDPAKSFRSHRIRIHYTGYDALNVKMLQTFQSSSNFLLTSMYKFHPFEFFWYIFLCPMFCLFLNNCRSFDPFGIFFLASYLLTRVPGGDDLVRGDGNDLKMK